MQRAKEIQYILSVISFIFNSNSLMGEKLFESFALLIFPVKKTGNN